MDADEADALRPGDQVIRRVNPCTLGGFTAEVGETYTVKHSLTPVNPGLVLVEDPEGHTFSPLKFDRVEPVRTMLNLQPGDYILRLPGGVTALQASWGIEPGTVCTFKAYTFTQTGGIKGLIIDECPDPTYDWSVGSFSVLGPPEPETEELSTEDLIEALAARYQGESS